MNDLEKERKKFLIIKVEKKTNNKSFLFGGFVRRCCHYATYIGTYIDTGHFVEFYCSR